MGTLLVMVNVYTDWAIFSKVPHVGTVCFVGATNLHKLVIVREYVWDW